jgi:hypothetical protein
MPLSSGGCMLSCTVWSTHVDRRFVCFPLACLVWVGFSAACAAEALTPSAAMYAKFASLQQELARNDFGRPLHLDSKEAPDKLGGDVHAIVAYPFALVKSALDGPQRWCEILILHLNIKGCRVADTPSNELRVYVGRKFDEPVNAAHKLEFSYRVVAQAPDYFALSLNADSGPFGTRDYRIIVEAVPLDQGRSFLHLSYAYAFGASAKMAMQAYLRTIGSQKVGFTASGRGSDGQPVLVGGMRGALERNVMRYYLAIDAYLAALAAPPDERLEERLKEWFDATERYPLQLHELDQDAYLEMKRRECASSQIANQ